MVAPLKVIPYDGHFAIVNPDGDAEVGNWLLAECQWEADAKKIVVALEAMPARPTANERVETREAEIDLLQRALVAARRDEKHWRANHDHIKMRLAALLARPDLPIERTDAWRKLCAFYDAKIAALEAPTNLQADPAPHATAGLDGGYDSLPPVGPAPPSAREQQIAARGGIAEEYADCYGAPPRYPRRQHFREGELTDGTHSHRRETDPPPPPPRVGWTCGRCNGPVAGRYATCERCGLGGAS